jgi:hypothetical protein
MQASTSQKPKGELISEIKGKQASWTIKDISQNGVKMEMNDEGTITGKYSANFMETISIHRKSDGTITWESRGIEMAGPDMVVTTGKGTAKSNGPNNVWEGEITYMTHSPKLSWLNNTKGWIEGTANQAERQYTAKVYAKK